MGNSVTALKLIAPASGSNLDLPGIHPVTVDITVSEAGALSAVGEVKDNTGVTMGVAGSGVTAVESGVGNRRTTVLTLAKTNAFTVADDANLCDGHLVYTFPAGEILIESVSASINVTLAEDSANAAAELGMGNVIGSDAQATLGADNAGCENFLGPIATADMAGAANVLTQTQELVLATADPHLVHVNIGSTWNDTAGTDLTGDLAGTVTINWLKL